MLNIARLPTNDRRDLFRAAAQQMRVNEAIVEKDFWVCWTLDYLFHESPWQDKLAFKGGTSLSKAYGVIERFSEDIDLILDWTLLGYEKDTPWKQDSKTKRALFCGQANDRCVAFLAGTFVPQVLTDLTKRAGPAINVIPNGQEVLIEYPKAFSAASILPQIKLEIGPIAEWFPQEPRSITPYAAEQYPDKFASRPQGIKKILSQTLGLPFVKPITIRQVGGGLFQNLNLHLIRSRTACLASAIFRKRDEPSEIRISRTHRTSACHAGEGTFEALRDRSTQISSIASILSVVPISLRGITSCIRTSKFSKA